MTRYDSFAEHILNGVPQETLDAARDALTESLTGPDAIDPKDPDELEAAAHAMVAALRRIGAIKTPTPPPNREDLLKTLRFAISDPGAFTRRGDDYRESIPGWGARAVLIALTARIDAEADAIREIIRAAQSGITVGFADFDPATIRNFGQFCEAAASNAARDIAARRFGLSAAASNGE